MKHSAIPRQYLLDEQNRKVAVMIDIDTFNKIEDDLENFGLMQFIKENKKEKPLTLAEAKTYYGKLKKSK